MIGALEKQVDILFIEDNPGDVELTKEAFKNSSRQYQFHVIEDGMEAMNYLYRKGGYTNASRPDLIVLDLNLPKKDGRMIFTELRADESFKEIPIVILTSSIGDRDMIQSYHSPLNCYITKPIHLDQFLAIGKTIEDWLFSL